MSNSGSSEHYSHVSTNRRDRTHIAGNHIIHIDNIAEISAAYGAKAAVQAEEFVHCLVVEHLGKQGKIARLSGGTFLVTASHIPRQAIYSFLQIASHHPVHCNDRDFHVAISLKPSAHLAYVNLESKAIHRFGNVYNQEDARWICGYRQSMALAVRLFKSFKDESFEFNVSPIRYVNNCDIVLYHELIASPPPLTDLATVRSAIRSAKHLGLIRAVEEHMVRLALRKLIEAPDLRAAVNISIESASHDAWWFSIYETLESLPCIARRLIFEVNGVEILLPMEARRCLAAVKHLGCQIAIDNLNAETSCLRTPDAFSFDIAKIDASLVQRAKVSGWSHRKLISLIDKAASASLVVVQGIETQEDSKYVSDLGCCWQQGPHFEASKDILDDLPRQSLASSDWGLRLSRNPSSGS